MKIAVIFPGNNFQRFLKKITVSNNTKQPQQNINFVVGLDMKMTLHSTTPPPPPHHTNSMGAFRSLQLSKPQPNLNTTVGFYMKMTLQPPPPPTHQKLNVSNISADTDPILTKI